MNLQEFIFKYNGQPVDFDGMYNAQCVDLTKQWEHEMGWPLIQGNAIDQPKNADKSFYDFISHDPNNGHAETSPAPGDLMVFNYGTLGHISIFIAGDHTQFKSFDQNNPVGSVCHEQSYKNYKNVIGWIRPKGASMNMYEDPVAWEEIINAIRQFRLLVLGHIDEAGANADALRVKNAHTGGELKAVFIDIWNSDEAKAYRSEAQVKLDQIKEILQ